MKLSQLVAEATARLADLRARHGADAGAECFVSIPADELNVEGTELFLGTNKPRYWYFELKTEKDSE